MALVSWVLALTLFHRWENSLRRNTKILTIYVELAVHKSMHEFLSDAREHGISISNIQMEKGDVGEEELICFIATAKNKDKAKKEIVLQNLKAMTSIQYLEEL